MDKKINYGDFKEANEGFYIFSKGEEDCLTELEIKDINYGLAEIVIQRRIIQELLLIARKRFQEKING